MTCSWAHLCSPKREHVFAVRLICKFHFCVHIQKNFEFDLNHFLTNRRGRGILLAFHLDLLLSMTIT